VDVTTDKNTRRKREGPVPALPFFIFSYCKQSGQLYFISSRGKEEAKKREGGRETKGRDF
jgi:hypothetical protein